MNTVVRKMKTSVEVMRKRGGLAFTVELIANLLPAKTASAFRGNDHWWVGKLVELNGNAVKIDSCKFHLASPAISTTIKTRFVFDTYEQPERAAIKEFLATDLPVVEFGAGVGVVSCLTNRLLRHPENHVVVEANPDLIDVIEKNRAQNGCRFAVANRALAYGCEWIDFHQGGDFLSNSLMTPAGKTISVKTITLAQALAESGFATINLLLDVEGEEVELVKNEMACLRRRVKVFILEIHPSIVGAEAISTMLATLEQAGFQQINNHPTVRALRNTNL